jgi:hypothetical protein
MSEGEQFWRSPEPGETAPPPVAREEIRRWEEQRGVRLPARLAEALASQDGGPVDGTVSLYLEPLEQIESLGDDTYDFIYQEEGASASEVSDRHKLFLVGHDCGCGIVLDYRGKQEPSILILEAGEGGRLTDLGARTFDDLVVMARRSMPRRGGRQDS